MDELEKSKTRQIVLASLYLKDANMQKNVLDAIESSGFNWKTDSCFEVQPSKLKGLWDSKQNVHIRDAIINQLVISGDTNALKEAYRRGLDINEPNCAISNGGYTKAVVVACFKEQLNVLKALIKMNADLDIDVSGIIGESRCFKSNNSILLIASHQINPKLISILLKAKKFEDQDLLNAASYSINSSRHWNNLDNVSEILKLILEKNPTFWKTRLEISTTEIDRLKYDRDFNLIYYIEEYVSNNVGRGIAGAMELSAIYGSKEENIKNFQKSINYYLNNIGNEQLNSNKKSEYIRDNFKAIFNKCEFDEQIILKLLKTIDSKIENKEAYLTYPDMISLTTKLCFDNLKSDENKIKGLELIENILNKVVYRCLGVDKSIYQNVLRCVDDFNEIYKDTNKGLLASCLINAVFSQDGKYLNDADPLFKKIDQLMQNYDENDSKNLYKNINSALLYEKDRYRNVKVSATLIEKVKELTKFTVNGGVDEFSKLVSNLSKKNDWRKDLSVMLEEELLKLTTYSGKKTNKNTL